MPSSNPLLISEPGSLGDVDEVAVWNKGLTQATLQNLYQLGKK